MSFGSGCSKQAGWALSGLIVTVSLHPFGMHWTVSDTSTDAGPDKRASRQLTNDAMSLPWANAEDSPIQKILRTATTISIRRIPKIILIAATSSSVRDVMNLVYANSDLV